MPGGRNSADKFGVRISPRGSAGNHRQGRSRSRIHRLPYLLAHRKCSPMNPNKALWEKGDFTRIAATMRESGEALVQRELQKG